MTTYAAGATGDFQVELKPLERSVEVFANNNGQGFSKTDLRLEGSDAVSLGDHDLDGQLDILLTGEQTSRIYENQGDFNFTESKGSLTIGTLTSTDDLISRFYSGFSYYKYDYNFNDLFSKPQDGQVFEISLTSGVHVF